VRSMCLRFPSQSRTASLRPFSSGEQEIKAFADDAFDILGADMRVANRSAARLADANDLGHVPHDFRVLVFARVAEFLAEIAFTDQSRSDARQLGQYLIEILDGKRILDHQDDEDFTRRIEGPYIGSLAIFCLGKAPKTSCRAGAIATNARGPVAWCGL
jgi:hypothetical protein